MSKYQIDYQKDYSYIQTANLWHYFKSENIFIVLKAIWLLGIFSYILILLDYLKLVNFEALIYVFKFLGFLGVKSFIIYVFLRLYFRQEERLREISPDKNNFNVFAIADLEVARIFGKYDLNNCDLGKLFSDIVSSKRVIFALNEMGVTDSHLSIILTQISASNGQESLGLILDNSIESALAEGEKRLTTADIFYGFIKLLPDFDSFGATLELELNDIRNILFWANSVFNKAKYQKPLIEKLKTNVTGIGEDWAYGYTLYLDIYGMHINGPKFFDESYVVGRKHIISQIETVLSKPGNNNCLLIGEPGSGKKTIVNALAAKLFSYETTKELKHKRIIQLNTEALVAGVQNPQEIQQRLIMVLQDAAQAGNIILFIDNIHTLFQGGNGKVGAVDATEVLSPYLQSGEIRVIGATTQRNYESYLSPKSSFAGLFENIKIPPTTKDQTIKVLADLSLYFFSKYQVRLTYNALKEIYRIADQFIDDREFPRKAIDLMENVISCAKRDSLDVIDKQIVSRVCEGILSIPVATVAKEEKNSLLKLEEVMHQRVVSQDEAISAIVNALKRKRAQVNDSARPIGVFLFLGPTGVGKTEVAKTLAQSYFGDEKAIIRMDMNQYQEPSSIKDFLGQKQTGLDELEGGQLVKEIKQKPFSVILLDELEKAHKNILNIFLQIFDEGYTKDGMGNIVKFTNSIIITTSNAEANMIREGLAKNRDWQDLKEEVFESLQKKGIFTPEFLNRFDEVVMFKPLTQDNLRQIAKNIIAKMIKDFESKGYLIEINKDVLNILIEKGYQPEFGARPMRRAIQDILENFLADKIIKDEIKKGEKFVVNKQDLLYNIKNN